MEEILGSFVEAVTCYFAWLCNEITEDYLPNEKDVEEIKKYGDIQISSTGSPKIINIES